MTSPHDVNFPWLRSIRAQLSSLDGFPLVVAFSGGLDSTCLLHMVCNVVPARKVVALHVNHGLSANADAWQLHCQQICHAWGCQFQAHKVSIEVAGKGIEAAARLARYAVFERYLSAGEILLQGHHADDQVETILLNLLRGSGPSGMRGIPASRKLGVAELRRPLLSIRRVELEDYANNFDLSYINDESNQDTQFDRNYLRAEVVPRLNARFGHLYSAVKATSEAMLEAEHLQLALARQAADIASSELAVKHLLSLDVIRRRNIIRHWFEHHTGKQLSRNSLEQIVTNVLAASIDASPSVQIGPWSVRRSRQVLAIMPTYSESEEWSAAWDFKQPLQTPYGILRAEPQLGGRQLPEKVDVSFRRGGEKMRPVGRGLTKTLKSLFKENNIPLWKRGQAPIIRHHRQLLWVAHLGFDESCHCVDTKMGWRLIWQEQSLSFDT